MRPAAQSAGWPASRGSDRLPTSPQTVEWGVMGVGSQVTLSGWLVGGKVGGPGRPLRRRSPPTEGEGGTRGRPRPQPTSLTNGYERQTQRLERGGTTGRCGWCLPAWRNIRRQLALSRGARRGGGGGWARAAGAARRILLTLRPCMTHSKLLGDWGARGGHHAGAAVREPAAGRSAQRSSPQIPWPGGSGHLARESP